MTNLQTRNTSDNAASRQQSPWTGGSTRTKVEAKSVAIIIIDTAQHVLARNALMHSLKSFEFQQVLIFSDDQNQWQDFSIIPIPSIRSVEEYNRIVTSELPKHIKTDFGLIVQYDGFVLNPAQFSPHFYFYDYIGAPWHHFTSMNVGNGGFSWRSRKLIEAVADIPYPELSIAEDIFICREQRPLLEKAHGIVFAPPAIAAHFSVESTLVPFPTFGFHGIFHLPDVYRHSIDFLVENLNPLIANRWQHLLIPSLERVSAMAASRLKERIRLSLMALTENASQA